MLARGQHVVVGGEEQGRQDARAEVGAEDLGPGDQVFPVHAEDLALGDDDLDVEVLAERPHAAFLERGAEPAQDVERGVHGPAHVLGRRNVRLPVVAQDADPEPAQILAWRLAVPHDRPLEASFILRVVAGEGLQHERAIVDGPRERPAVIERVGVGDHARPAHQPERGHEADDAAEGRRASNGPAGVRAEGHRHHAGRDGGARSARRAAREAGEVPRVPRRRPGQIERGPRVRHLVRGQFSQQDGAGVVELGRRGGILSRDAVDEDPRVAGGEDARRVVDVLEPEGNAVERAAVYARRDLGLGLPGLAAGQVEGARDERVRLRVQCLHAADQRVDQLHGRQPARRDQPRKLGYGEVVDFCGHHA